MQLAAEVVEHFRREPDARMFITTVADGIASIYPMRAWQQNLDRLHRELENPEEAEDLEFWANAHGACTQMDSLGRVIIPAKLRQMFQLDGEPLMLVAARDRIDIYRLPQFEERERQLAQRVAETRKVMLRRGVA